MINITPIASSGLLNLKKNGLMLNSKPVRTHTIKNNPTAMSIILLSIIMDYFDSGIEISQL